MQTRTFPKELVEIILRGPSWSYSRRSVLHDYILHKTDTPQAGTDDAKRARVRAFHTLTASQRAMLASHRVRSPHGGDRTSLWTNRRTIEKQATRYRCSVRLVKMAIKLRKVEDKRPTLLRAVASGTIGLADALAHVDRSTPELRKAIKAVEQRKARSLRQAFA